MAEYNDLPQALSNAWCYLCNYHIPPDENCLRRPQEKKMNNKVRQYMKRKGREKLKEKVKKERKSEEEDK